MANQSAKRRQKKSRIGQQLLLVLLVAAILLFRLVEDIGEEKTGQERFRVVNVVDGDTFELTGGDRLRLLAIDAPEKGQPLYDLATEYLRSLTLNKVVRIEYGGRRRDRYGRLLGFIYLDSVFVNAAMLSRGLANLYLFKDTRMETARLQEMLSAQREAMKNEKGIWALEHEPEYYYVGLPGSFRFHRPSCSSVNRLTAPEYIRYEIRLQPMASGLSPCRNCQP